MALAWSAGDNDEDDSDDDDDDDDDDDYDDDGYENLATDASSTLKIVLVASTKEYQLGLGN